MSDIIGPAVRHFRRRRSLSQQELADLAGVSKATVARVETRGTAQPGTVRKLAAALDVDVVALTAPAEPFADAFARHLQAQS
jgi:transcriptional regulator with XRE-family HTH domain